MKWYYQYAVLLLSLLALVTSCSNESDGSDDFVPYMEARINGELIVTNNVQVYESNWIDEPACIYRIRGDWSRSPHLAQVLRIDFPRHGGMLLQASYDVFEEEVGDVVEYWTIDYCETPEDPDGYNVYNDVSFTINHVGNNIYRGVFSFEVSVNCREKVLTIEGQFEIKSEIPLCEIRDPQLGG